MNYKNLLTGLRKDIIGGINAAMSDIENGVVLLFNDSIDSDTHRDPVCGEVFNLNEISKDDDGDVFIISCDAFGDRIYLDELNTEDLGAILDTLNAKEYEVDEEP